MKTNMNDNVVLVDKNDNEIGLMPKLEAHQKGLLHRAFSIFIFNYQGELLMQKRAKEKYHSGGLWSNTCCSNPLPGETIEQAANRRLMEEMGISCIMKSVFSFTYEAKIDNGLTEHEYDYILFGNFDNAPEVNPDEVMDWKYMDLEDLKVDIKKNPDAYTEWLKICIDEVKDHVEYAKMEITMQF